MTIDETGVDKLGTNQARYTYSYSHSRGHY